ncbi:hypothetical protein [uncultured Lentibacter sp.]|uniref:hypothetical protein n=1 Tax=uncultured Lentibacter sp. TaxID=1659309 RepID=UPI00261A6D43|nr:hypothetical protein [uncultured Lentibacter sp.]
MLTLSHGLNLLILLPLLAAFLFTPESMTPAFGPDTNARRILVCLYATIAVASMVSLALLATGYTETGRHISVTLFALQIVYKSLTVLFIGFGSSVVVTNGVVVLVHSTTLLTLYLSRHTVA